MDLGLEGRRALITGSYRGTGAGIATVLAAEGAHVIVHGFEPGQPDAVIAAIEATGGEASGLVGDIGTDAGAEALADMAGPVDVLVNNYGTPVGSTWASTDNWAAEWEDRIPEPTDIGQVVAFVASEAAWHINGADIAVDGGAVDA